MNIPSGIVLASSSPRRSELLISAGVCFQIMSVNIEESLFPGESPDGFALRLAGEKARKAAETGDGRFFIGADTIVVLEDQIMGKPVDAADAACMLTALSGKNHSVVTAYSILDRATGKEWSEAVRTLVWFKELRRDEIDRYVAGGCPLDKAGAYAIQGEAAFMVRKIDGSYTNVVGLPLCETVEALREMGALD